MQMSFRAFVLRAALLKKFIFSFASKIGQPVIIFVGLQIVWIFFTILWVLWFLKQNEAMERISQVLGETSISPFYGRAILTLGCIFLGLILLGMFLLFIFIQKQKSLIRQQKSFVSSITHELKSPLASLQLSFETLQRDNLPRQIAQKLVSMVEGDIDRLTRLVNRILLSGQIERGVYDFGAETEVFNLRKFIEALQVQVNYMDINIDGRLIIDCPQDLLVCSFKAAFSLVVGNLLENSIKYSPRGTPIYISVIQEDFDLLIKVKDEGFGLIKKDVKKIFKMFYRSGLAVKKALPGTGLGLYLVKSTVRILGGEVWVTSKGPGQGSTFFVKIPHNPLTLKDTTPAML